MKFALFTGCVAKGATRELMLSTTKAAEGLGFEFVEMKSASCCGAFEAAELDAKAAIKQSSHLAALV